MPTHYPGNPSDVMVIRDITPNITTLSMPFARFGVVKVGGRATLGMPLQMRLFENRHPFLSLEDHSNIPQLLFHLALSQSSPQYNLLRR